MDVTTVPTATGIATLVVALLALVVGALAWVDARRGRRAITGEVEEAREGADTLAVDVAALKESVESLSGEVSQARATARPRPDQEESEYRLDVLEEQLRAAVARADGLDARIRILEGRLRDLPAAPPPMTAARRGDRLEDLRA